VSRFRGDSGSKVPSHGWIIEACDLQFLDAIRNAINPDALPHRNSEDIVFES